MFLHPVDWTRGMLSLQKKPVGEKLRTIARSRPFQILVLLLAVCIAIYSIYRRFQPQTIAPCITDFYSYYHSALRIGQGVAPYAGLANWIRDHTANITAGPYTDASCMSGAILEYAYTPFLGVILLPFTWLPYTVALFIWDSCNLLFLGAAIYAFLRAARMSPGLPWLLALTGVAMLASPLRFDLYYAQIDIFLLFVVCVGLCARVEGHPALAGMLFAIACAIEPALLIMVGFLLWKREMKLAAVTVCGSLVLILAPFLWLGGKALQDMLIIWRFYGSQYAVTITNDAPKGVLLRLLTPYPYSHPLTNVPGLATALWLMIALVVLLIALPRIAPRPLAGDSRSFLDVGLVVTTALLISPWSENSQFTWLAVPFLAVYISLRRVGLGTPAGRKLLAGFVGALLLLFFLGDDIQYALLAHVGRNSVIAAVLVLLAATYLYPLFAISAVILYAQRVDPTGGGDASARSQDLHRWSQVKRVHIVGGPGTGKTTLSHELAGLLEIPQFELDKIAGAGLAPAFRMERPLAQRLADVERIASLPDWTTEGSFLWWTDELLRSADIIIWLDMSSHVALRRVIVRHAREYVSLVMRQKEMQSLLAAGRHPHLPHLFAFIRYTWAYYHRAVNRTPPTVEGLDDGWALTRADTERQLAIYVHKVIRCTRPADVTNLLRSVIASRGVSYPGGFQSDEQERRRHQLSADSQRIRGATQS